MRIPLRLPENRFVSRDHFSDSDMLVHEGLRGVVLWLEENKFDSLMVRKMYSQTADAQAVCRAVWRAPMITSPHLLRGGS
jgi:hypothetical protein